jgi:hypothetical protein
LLAGRVTTRKVNLPLRRFWSSKLRRFHRRTNGDDNPGYMTTLPQRRVENVSRRSEIRRSHNGSSCKRLRCFGICSSQECKICTESCKIKQTHEREAAHRFRPQHHEMFKMSSSDVWKMRYCRNQTHCTHIAIFSTSPGFIVLSPAKLIAAITRMDTTIPANAAKKTAHILLRCGGTVRFNLVPLPPRMRTLDTSLGRLVGEIQDKST